MIFTLSKEKWLDLFYVLKTKSFLKLFSTLFLTLILPFILITSFLIYKQYTEALDWNQKFQLIRVQLLAINIENLIRDELSIDSENINKTPSGVSKNSIIKHCLLEDTEFNTKQDLKLTSCTLDGFKKSYILLSMNNKISLFNADFLTDELLESPLGDPNEGLFLLNNDGNFGVSGFIEDDFLVSEFWKDSAQVFVQKNSKIAAIREIQKEGISYFIVSFPLYGLPLQLFVVSPKLLILNPILATFKSNIIILIFIFFVSILISGVVAKKEDNSKRILGLVLKEFPNAAILFDSKSNILLVNENINKNLDINSLFKDQKSLFEGIKKEVSIFLNNINLNSNAPSTFKREEAEYLDLHNNIYLLEITFHIWHSAERSRFANGALVIIEDTTGKRLEFLKEMDYARDLQKRYLPQNRIFPKGIDYEVFYAPLLQVGGDYYDYIELDDSTTIFVLGDIIGHGIQAAMMMTVVRVLLHQILKETKDPVKILDKMNEGVASNLPKSYAFVPFLFLIFNSERGTIEYGNAGHPGMLYFTGNKVYCPEKLNPMLGMIPGFKHKVLKYNINLGDRFYLFTDGLRDIKNLKSEQFGDVSLESFFHSMKDKHLSVVKSELELKIKTFSQGASYADDITWMGIEVI